MEIGAQTDEKFFLVADEFAKVYKVQNEMQENQNRNWKLVEEQFAIVDHNLNAIATCMEIQATQQQLNFNFDTAASLLLTLYADIKSYRAALYSFRINVINAIPTLLDKRLPISLVPRKSLIKILDAVHDSQKNAPDRLTLAIPMTDKLSYYDAKLVQEISTVEDGLLLTLAIPLASSQTVFEVYRANVIPMPQKDSVDALQWVIEGEYLAISEGQMETTVLTKAQYDNCLGSPRYIKIRADLQSCQYFPAKRINVKLPDPLEHLIDSVPNINELPKYESSTEANLDLLKKVKTEFIFNLVLYKSFKAFNLVLTFSILIFISICLNLNFIFS